MQGITRKIFQAITYEAVAIFFIAPAIAYAYDDNLGHSTVLSIIISSVAVCWNMFYNYCFEYWEARQTLRERTLLRRTLHSIGFEGGMTILLLPVIAYWLNISLLQALIANIALFAFFFFYSFAFQYCFDKLFDVPNSAKPVEVSVSGNT